MSRETNRAARGRLVLAAAVLAAVVVAVAAEARCDPPDGGRYLLLDSRLVESASNAKLAVGTVRKSKLNPLFGEDRPWERRFDNLYANVFFDRREKLYKCYYSPFIVDRSARGMTLQERLKKPYRVPGNREMAVCYATSRDGLSWEKPELSIAEYDGSKANNIVYRRSSASEHEPHGAGVFKDLHDPDPARRYKMFFKGKIISVAFSADGLHWGKGTPCPEANVRGDTHNNAFWAPTLKEYVGITRMWAKPRGRQVARTSSKDFLQWSRAEVVLEGLENHLQTYAMPVFYHAGVYLGLVAIYNSRTDRVHTELAWSPDTRKWRRVDPGHPLIPNGSEPGCYDWGCVYAAACPVFEKDEIRLYYGGSNGLHSGYRCGSFCLATLRPDGFAGYEPVSRIVPARITTRPIRVDGTLSVNADVERGGVVRVQLLDESGKQVAEAEPVDKTAVDARVAWRGGFNPAGVKGRMLRLTFELQKAKLYSFVWDGD